MTYEGIPADIDCRKAADTLARVHSAKGDGLFKSGAGFLFSLFTEHEVRALKRAKNGDLTLLRQARRPGIEEGMSAQYAGNGYTAFASKTGFVSNIAADVANAVPDSPRLRAVNIVFAVIAPICGIISGMYASSFAAGAGSSLPSS